MKRVECHRCGAEGDHGDTWRLCVVAAYWRGRDESRADFQRIHENVKKHEYWDFYGELVDIWSISKNRADALEGR